MTWAARHLYREDALASRAEPEPIDGMAQVDLPHQRVFSAVLAAGVAALALWCAAGSMPRDLWLTGVFADGGAGALTVTVRMGAGEAGRLSIGAAGGILDPRGRGQPAVGVVAEIAIPPGGDAAAEVVWSIPEPGPWMAAGENCGLRVPMGRARPAEVLLDVLR